jgi:cytochrome c peroxidase
VAYQDVMLWNGQFGGTGTNAGTEDNWTIDTPKEANNFGFQGVETQVIA